MNSNTNPIDNIKFQISGNYGKQTCKPGWYWDHQTTFQDYDIFYVVSGRGEMRLGDEEFTLQKKTCIIFRPGDLPKATQDPNDSLTVIFIHFQIDRGEDGNLIVNDEVNPFQFPRKTNFEVHVPIENLLYRMMEILDFTSTWKEFEFECLLKQFFINLYRIHYYSEENSELSQQQIQKIRKTIHFIRDKQGMNIDFLQIADQVQLSPQYLSRMFKRYTGKSLKEFIVRCKLERARDLLAETPMNVSQAAEALGYSDAYTFSKRFKHYHGISPSQYIAKLRPTTVAPGSAIKNPEV